MRFSFGAKQLKKFFIDFCMINFFALIGKVSIVSLSGIGRFVTFFWLSVIGIVSAKRYYKQWFKQLIFIGYFSLPIVTLTAFFSGGVLALQSYTGFSRFSGEGAVATVVVLSITRELGPVLTALMASGRVGASIAAELSTMRVTEQIDALITLSTNPIRYLVVPRLVASIISLPLLTLIANIIGVMGGYLVAVYQLDFNSTEYLLNTTEHLKMVDIGLGLIKSFAFAIIIAIVSCYFGYYATGGAKGVGRATTQSVVTASIAILFSNYLITELFF